MKYEKTIFDCSVEGRVGFQLPPFDLASIKPMEGVNEKLVRKSEIRLPQVSELDVVRHYTKLSMKNHGVETGMYPLGSCTMKYNPKINEKLASYEEFSELHPLVPSSFAQGSLELLHRLQGYLEEITGMAKVCLQPSAGSQGELLGLMVIKSRLKELGQEQRNTIIIPDSAHGTNPASVAMVGFKVVEIASNEEGLVDPDELKAHLNEETAGFMVTNPNTLGLFEKNIAQIARLVHEAGGLMYCDGANMNANLGIARPADMGFDIVHLNLHKTFSTPHGGGGPGSGPIGVVDSLVPHLPLYVEKNNSSYEIKIPELSVGSMKSFYGNFAVLLRAYAYIRALGAEGLKEASVCAVLNANYMKERLKKEYQIFNEGLCKHEFVLAGLKEGNTCTTLHVAKRLMDCGVHPPTIYFPLIVHEAMMIEPTESESKESLDDYVDALLAIAKEAKENPDLVQNAPYTTTIRRLDETTAARNPILSYFQEA